MISKVYRRIRCYSLCFVAPFQTVIRIFRHNDEMQNIVLVEAKYKTIQRPFLLTGGEEVREKGGGQ